MRLALRTVGVVAGILIVWNTSGASAQDWPQWRGPHRDGKTAGFVAPQAWPKTLARKWRTTVGLGDATPALVAEKLYVFTRQGDDEVIQCLSATDGNRIWETKYPAEAVKGAAASHPGPRSSPAVADGKVVTLGVSGVVSCLDAGTGKLLWSNSEYKTVPQFYTATSPILVDGLAIVHLGGKGQGALVAFDLASGTAKWKWTGDAPAYASPVLMTVEGTKQLVQQAEKNLVGISLTDGKLLWKIATPTQGRVYNSATPIVDGQTVIYTGQGAGTKAVKIEKQGDAFAVKQLWSNDNLGTGYNTPVLHNGLLFGMSDRTLFFCLDAQTGKELWTDSAKRDRFGSIVDAGSVLLALPEKSGLIVFKPSREKYEQLAQIPVSDGPIYAHPVVAGKRIFVKDRDAVTLWMVE